MKIAKKQRRQINRAIRAARNGLASRSPEWAQWLVGPFVDYLDMLFIDHGIFRLVYANCHQISEEAWRASQPAPHDIRRYARLGIRTIVNLRGARDCGSYRLEAAACARHGIRLVDFPLKSRAAPPAEVLHLARALLDEIEYPVLLHCKSGADRAGLMSALYLLFRARAPVEEALAQLHWRYGHFRQANTGVLDHFFESYLRHRLKHRGHGTPQADGETEAFFDWVEKHYDAEQLKNSFRARSWANVLVNRILRRE